MQMNPRSLSNRSSRRDFLKTSAAVAGALAAVPQVHAAGSDVLKIGLIGCGGRGSGAAAQALKADPNVKLTAMGDMFADRLEYSLNGLKRDKELSDMVDVPADRQFVGFDAYKNVIASGVDVVLLCTPPHFRPLHIKAAVEAGKHLFAEKPVAVDAPGVRSVLESCRLAKEKGLAVGSGLCWRYHYVMRGAMERIHAGDIGDIVALQCSYNTRFLWSKERQADWTDMEWQLRNWLYFTWLSGDFNVEQHVHSLDKMAWAMQDYPVKAVGLGGRQVRTNPKFGNIFDHHAVVYEYKSGVKLFSYCRQQDGCAPDVSDHVMGSRGTCHIDASKGEAVIVGDQPWKYTGVRNQMYQTEHDELFASIRKSQPINDGEWMSKTTLMAIMGRMATYTGQAITWDMAMNSKEDLTPPKYEFGPLAVAPVAMPGVTKFV
jgi:predicted dehydrogenase